MNTRFKTWHVEAGKRKVVSLDEDTGVIAETVKDLHSSVGEY